MPTINLIPFPKQNIGGGGESKVIEEVEEISTSHLVETLGRSLPSGNKAN